MITEVARITGMNPIEILEGRSWNSSLVRQLYWKLLRDREKRSLTEIARLSGKTHGTVSSGIKRVESLMEVDGRVAEMWRELEPPPPPKGGI